MSSKPPYPIDNNLDNRKANKKASQNKFKVESTKTNILDSEVINLFLASAVYGKHMVLDRDTDEVIIGEDLPMDLLVKARTTLFNKVIPATKEIIESDAGDSTELLTRVLDSIEKQDKRDTYLAEEKVIDAEFSED
jgi:hypothetical protein